MLQRSEKICPSCWARNPAEEEVCRACGTSLSDVAVQSADTSAAKAETQPTPSETGQPGAARVVYTPQNQPTEENLSMLADRYRLVYEIARGGMGIVYLAEDTFLDNLPVAIKLLIASISPDLNAEKRLKREALTAMRLSHENIMRLYSFDHFEGKSYLVMEYINGPTLEGLTNERRKLTPAEVTLFMRPTCEALYYAHEQGVVHRDIKPANIMLSLPKDSPFASKMDQKKRRRAASSTSPTVSLTDGGGADTMPQPSPPQEEQNTGKPLVEFNIEHAQTAKIKICDFGIAQQLRQTMTRLTGTSLIGSPVYMSPEQLEGADLDHRTDIYSLGVSVFEMLTGELPFEGSMHSLTYQIMEKGPPPVHGVDKTLSDVVLKCMAKDPRDRWQDCLEFAQAMEDVLEGKSTGVSVPDSVYGSRTKTLRKGTQLENTVTSRRSATQRAGLTDRHTADLRMAKLSFEEKLFDKSLEEMKQYRLLHGDSEELLTFAAQCVDTLVGRRAFAQAHDFCQFVLLIDSENPNVYLTIGRIQRVLGRTEDAERNLRMAMMYGAEDDAVEKELRGTLSDLRLIDSELAAGGKVLHLTPARIGLFIGAELLALTACIVIALVLATGFQEHQVVSYFVIGLMLAAAAGASNLLLTTLFSGPMDEFSRRGARIKKYLARHGYAMGLIGIAVIGAVVWLILSALFYEQMPHPLTVFAIVFGLVVWAGSVFYSWFVVYNALGAKTYESAS